MSSCLYIREAQRVDAARIEGSDAIGWCVAITVHAPGDTTQRVCIEAESRGHAQQILTILRGLPCSSAF